MSDPNELERWVKDYHAAGQAWVAAKLKADQLDEFSKSLLAKIKNNLELESTEKLSEAKLERMALGFDAYIEHIKAVNLAKSDMLSKRVRFDALDKWFEAKRSGLSFEKEVIRKGIFHEGGNHGSD